MVGTLRNRFTLLLSVLFALGAAAAPVKASSVRSPLAPAIALANVRAAPGVPAGVAPMLEQALEAELRTLEGASVVTASEVALVLSMERQKQVLGGPGGAAVAGLFAGIEASDLLSVQLAPQKAGYQLDARRFGRDGAVLKTFALEVAPGAAELTKAAGAVVRALLPELKARPASPPPAPEPVVAAAPPASNRPIRVAVLEVRGAGDIPLRALAALNQSITPELRKLDGVSAIASSELADMLGMERQKQLMGCSDGASSCLEELAGALDADEMITFDLTLVGRTYALTARRTDLRKSKVVQTQLKQFEQRDGEELLAITGPSIAALYPDRPLKAGRTRGVEAAVVRRLNPPPLPRWVFGATSALAAATALTGGVFAYLRFDAQSDFNRLAQRSLTEPVRGSDFTTLQAKAQSSSTNANALFASAGALALVAVVEIFFTDWKDDRAAFSVQPVALLGGAGLGLSYGSW